jgi:multidrug transporter EmrE-like cation transporter
MTSRGLILVATAAVLTAVANLLLRGGIRKYGEFFLDSALMKEQIMVLAREPLFVFGVIFYGFAALVWFGALSIEDLSTSYPILVGLTFFLVVFGGIFFFGEQVKTERIVGMGFILVGIFFIGRA